MTSLSRYLACVAAALLATATARGDEPWPPIGRRVAIEGVAWGCAEKGYGQYVILKGTQVYVRNIDFAKHESCGKLVRVTGLLEQQVIPPAVPLAQGSSQVLVLHFIRAHEWQILDRVECPYFKVVKQPEHKTPKTTNNE